MCELWKTESRHCKWRFLISISFRTPQSNFLGALSVKENPKPALRHPLLLARCSSTRRGVGARFRSLDRRADYCIRSVLVGRVECGEKGG